MAWWGWLLVGVAVVLGVVVVYDLTQRRHALLRNFPVIGHFRYLLEGSGPSCASTSSSTTTPRSRSAVTSGAGSTARRSSANTYFGFGTDNDLEHSPGLPDHQAVVVPAGRAPPRTSAGFDPNFHLPCAKVLRRRRAARRRRSALPSVVNISSMSYGSLGAKAVESLNRGAALAGCLQGTGEGGISPHHHTAATSSGRSAPATSAAATPTATSTSRASATSVAAHPQIRADRDQAQPGREARAGRAAARSQGHAGDRARARRPEGVDCWSPSSHTAFHDADSLLDFVELLAAETRAAGRHQVGGRRPRRCSRDLARLMATAQRGLDFVTIDGGEGGTGAGPLVFARPRRAAVQDRRSPACTASSRKPASPTTSSSPAPGSSASPRTRCSRSRSGATRSTSAARRCCRSAASRRSAATPAAARPASPRNNAGASVASTRR